MHLVRAKETAFRRRTLMHGLCRGADARLCPLFDAHVGEADLDADDGGSAAFLLASRAQSGVPARAEHHHEAEVIESASAVCFTFDREDILMGPEKTFDVLTV
jgi:hypothetical protein